ncbi:hypothetical protein J6590_053997 [Homalodisca vitripennis]|nr:hypothetical protein J6590_053997 [Homalodisca vitripennis]
MVRAADWALPQTNELGPQPHMVTLITLRGECHLAAAAALASGRCRQQTVSTLISYPFPRVTPRNIVTLLYLMEYGSC